MTRPSPAVRTSLRALALVALTVTSAWATSNLNLSKSNINRIMSRGSLVTASVDVTGIASYLVYTTPSNADFVLTQVCTGNTPSGLLIQVGGAKIIQLAPMSCQTFEPGMLLPPGQTVSCTSFDSQVDSFCTLIGVLATPYPSTPTPRP